MITGISDAAWTEEYQEQLDALSELLSFTYDVEVAPVVNWNAEWESGFRQIVVEGFCRVRAPFHKAEEKVEYDIIIDPRMAFGTGHHETTRLMIRALDQVRPQGSNVVDFGAGSGILGILAAKMGATKVCAIEYDEHAVVNLKENIANNQTPMVESIWADDLGKIATADADLVLANITRNVLIEHASDLVRVLKDSGKLVVSGFIENDQDQIVTAFSRTGLKPSSFLKENEWIAQIFTKH